LKSLAACTFLRVARRFFYARHHAVGVHIEKETKALKKKMKRQEIANRAAEKELAEISLEQQVLRELRSKQTQKQDPQTTSQTSTVSTSVTDLTTATASSAVTATCVKSQPAVVLDWSSDKDKTQARISS